LKVPGFFSNIAEKRGKYINEDNKMISKLKIDYKIRYKDIGQGPVILLLHGYLESLKVWNGLVDELKNDFRLIVPDLPGHGHSEVSENVQTMESMAEAIMHLLHHLNIEKCFVVGHSLGGYVALAYLEKYPKMVMGISLFHSSPYADTEEKKLNRDREIELIKAGKKDQIYNLHTPKTFANENVPLFAEQIEKLKSTAKKTENDGIIAILEGMKVRPSRAELLKNTKVPVQYIIGRKDNFIPMQILEKLELPENADVVILDNSGHMGMFEEKEKAVEAIRRFVSYNLK
jgi:pimeloyl-ACP methyl ester carboxylesterase